VNDYIKLVISEVPQYLMNLLDLVISPKTFLASRGTPDADAANKASRAPGHVYVWRWPAAGAFAPTAHVAPDMHASSA
jgi:hypothetical protein